MVKRTLQEIANFFDMALAMDKNGLWYLYEDTPRVCEASKTWSRTGYYVSRWMVDYTGDWRDSLTLPDSWPKELPFKEGEIVVATLPAPGLAGAISRWNDRKVAEHWRRPTEAEWKKLRGEE